MRTLRRTGTTRELGEERVGRAGRSQRSTRLAMVIGALAIGGLGGCGGSPGSSAKSSATVHRAVADSGPLRPTGADWPTLLHGSSHFGAASVPGPRGATVRWRRQLEGPIVPAPITVGDTAYVASDGGDLHAIDIASGRDRWTFDGGAHYGSDLSTAPATLPSGLILWPGPRNRLFALTPQGKLRWTLTTTGSPLTPAIDPARALLVLADTAGELSGYRLGASEQAPQRLWSRQLASTSFGNPALAANGTTYETAGDSLFAITITGRTLWQVTTKQPVEVSAAVAADGTIVFGSNDRQEYGIGPDGLIRWHAPIGDLSYSSPLTLASGRVAFGNHIGQIRILDSRDGRLISIDQGHGQIWTAPAVDSRGDVYFASRTGGIYGFGPDGKPLFTLNTGAEFDSYPAISSDGTLLIGDDNGLLRAIRPG